MGDPNQEIPQQTPAQPEIPQQPTQSEISPQQANSNWLKTLSIGLGVVGIGLVIGIGGYFLVAKKSQPPIQKVVVQVSPTPTTDPTATWKTYRNKIYNYSLKYPLDWREKESCQGRSSVQDSIDANVCFLSPDFIDSEAGDIWQRGYTNGGLVTVYKAGFRGHGLPSDKDVCTYSQIEGKMLECGSVTTSNDIVVWRAVHSGWTEAGVVKDSQFFIRVVAFGDGQRVIDQILSTFKFTK